VNVPARAADEAGQTLEPGAAGRSVTSPPSGEQHEIRHGEHRAIVCEVGATLRSYTVGGADVLDGFSIDEASPAGRGQVLAPWPNRLEDGSYIFEGRTGQAALDEPERGNAIHGLVRWLPWEAVRPDASAVTLTCVLHPQPGYPWRLVLETDYRLGGDGLTTTIRATNASDAAAPFGIGFHPYVTVGTPFVDEALLSVPAEWTLPGDDRGVPTGERAAVVGSPYDFTSRRPIGRTRLDTAYTGLTGDADGLTRVVLAAPDGGTEIVIWADGAFGHLMIYTGDTLQPVERRRRGIAIEPMTCPPNALRTGDDVIRLEPDTPWSASWGISPRFESNGSSEP